MIVQAKDETASDELQKTQKIIIQMTSNSEAYYYFIQLTRLTILHWTLSRPCGKIKNFFPQKRWCSNCSHPQSKILISNLMEPNTAIVFGFEVRLNWVLLQIVYTLK